MAKVQKAALYRDIANNINSGYIGTNRDGRTFHVVEPERGKKQVLEEIAGTGIVKFIDPAAVVGEALKFVINVDMGVGSDLTHRDMCEAIKYWMAITNPADMPIYLAEKSQRGLCFQRLPFDYSDDAKETPVLDEFIGRCTNSDAVRMFIGSLFVENSSRFQYLWMYGPGGEGKGSFGRALARLIGPGSVSMPVPKTDSQKQFLAYSILGKRLCIFPECENFAFPNDPLFKQFTGHDDVWIEQKGKQGYSASINAKFCFLTNTRAGVQGTDANTRRLIYSEIGKPGVKYSSTVYDALLASEMPDFILKCRKFYLESCPQGEDISVAHDETTKELLEFNEERFEVLTAYWLEIGADHTISPTQLQEIKKNEHLSTTEYRQWIEYMRTRLGIKIQFTRDKNVTRREWRGIKRKPIDFVTRQPVTA